MENALLPAYRAIHGKISAVPLQALREIWARFFRVSLRTIVVQWARCWRAFDARDRAEIFVDGAEVMFSHVLKIGPWHNLQKIPVEGLWHAARIKDPWWTGWVQMIHIHASSHDQSEVGKRVAPFRQPSFVRRQVAGDDMRRTTAWRKIAEISSSTQIGCRIDLLRLAKEWVSAR